MRVIYRSASRLHISGWQLFLRDLTQHALNATLPFIKKYHVCRLLLNVLSWFLVPILVIFVGVLVLLAVLYKYALQMLLERLGTNGQAEIEWNSGDVVSFLLHVEGTPDKVEVKAKLSAVLEERLSSTGRVSKFTKTLTSKMGIHSWKKQDNFNLDNHVYLMSERWRGARLTEDTLRLYINEICSFPFQCNHPPWAIYFIPYTNSVTLVQSQAVLVRLHSGLLRDHTLEDIFPCNTTNIYLKKLIARVFQDGHSNVQPGWFPKLLQRTVKISPLIFESPRILLTDLLLSSPLLSARNASHIIQRDRKALFWSGDVPRDLVQKIKKAAGTSSHVVLLSCIAGALRRYFQITGIKTQEKVLCLLPVCRDPMASVKQDMPSAFHTLSLPLSKFDPVTRLHRVQSSMDRCKRFPVRLQMSAFAYRFLPTVAYRMLSSLITRKYPTVISNTFLDSECGDFLGYPVTSVCCWNSFQFKTGLSLSLIHYADKICLSAMSKASVLQWPDLFVSCFQRQVYDLALALNVRIERKPSPPPSPSRTERSLYQQKSDSIF